MKDQKVSRAYHAVVVDGQDRLSRIDARREAGEIRIATPVQLVGGRTEGGRDHFQNDVQEELLVVGRVSGGRPWPFTVQGSESDL